MSNELIIAPDRGAVAERAIDAERLLALWMSGRSPQTVAAYTDDLRAFAAWFGGAMPGAAIDRLLHAGAGEANEIARTYRSHMVDSGLSPATVNRRLSALRSLVTTANEIGFINWQLLTKNVKAQAYRDTRGPKPADIVRILQLAGAHPTPAKAARDVALVTLIYSLGLRVSEALSLDVPDVDVRRAAIDVQRKGKTEKTHLNLSPQALKALRGWMRKRDAKVGPLFVSIDRHGNFGDRLARDGVERIMEWWGDELGLVLRPHGLRHAAITEALEHMDVRAVRKFSGHAKIDTVLIYDDNREDLGGELSKKISEALDKTISGLVREDESAD